MVVPALWSVRAHLDEDRRDAVGGHVVELYRYIYQTASRKAKYLRL